MASSALAKVSGQITPALTNKCEQRVAANRSEHCGALTELRVQRGSNRHERHDDLQMGECVGEAKGP